MGLFNDVVTIGTGGVYSPDKGFSAPGYGIYTNSSVGSRLGIDEDLKDLIPGIGDARAQDKANAINILEAQKNRDFQERMSSTAYERAMADMRKSGLNPMLAYAQGGASAPSGATANVEASSKTGLANFALSALTGIGNQRNATTGLQQQQTMNESAIQLNAANSAKAAADAERTRADTKRIRSETKALGKKESEGSFWKLFYDGSERLIRNAAKQIQESNKDRAPLIKSLGPASKKESQSIFPTFSKGIK